MSVLKQPTNFSHNDLQPPPNGQSHPDHANSVGGGNQKQSMLEKFKLFNREKTADRAKQQQIAKRTSSSSGFSSAKSERSDSSLSLNEHTPTSGNRYSNGNAHRNSTGASSGLMRKSESHQLRLSSKVKCPSQSPSTSNLSRLSTGSDKGTLKQPRKTDKLTNGKGKDGTGVPKPKQIPGSLKLEPRPPPPMVNGSKTNSLPRGSSGRMSQNGTLPSPGKANLIVNNSSTGIPKPMAAIKGTSKIPMNGVDDPSRMNVVKPQPQQQGFNASGYYVQNIPGCSTNGMDKEPNKAQIMNSMEVEIQDDSNKNYNNIINAVMGKSGVGMTDSTNSSSTSTTGLYSNSSESSVIFRPGSESGGSESMRSGGPSTLSSPLRNVIPNRKMDKFAQDQMSQNKFHTAPMFKPTTAAGMNGHHHPDNCNTSSMGMRTMLDDFNSNVTLPTRGHRGQRQFTLAQPSYPVEEPSHGHLGSNCGYLSDGDAFRKIGKPYLTAYNVDIENGYLSDGCNPNKHMMNVIRRRQMLPTTIEER